MFWLLIVSTLSPTIRLRLESRMNDSIENYAHQSDDKTVNKQSHYKQETRQAQKISKGVEKQI